MSGMREELQEQVDKLKEIRETVGLSRKAFSEYIGIPLRNLEEWEAGRRKMAELFDRDVKTIGKHINNALKEELDNEVVVTKFATTTR